MTRSWRHSERDQKQQTRAKGSRADSRRANSSGTGFRRPVRDVQSVIVLRPSASDRDHLSRAFNPCPPDTTDWIANSDCQKAPSHGRFRCLIRVRCQPALMAQGRLVQGPSHSAPSTSSVSQGPTPRNGTQAPRTHPRGPERPSNRRRREAEETRRGRGGGWRRLPTGVIRRLSAVLPAIWHTSIRLFQPSPNAIDTDSEGC